MKIFISHSSKDKFIADRIAKDLMTLEFETFLDAKDIATGDLIDTSVGQGLRDADEVLILLSPAALESQWVLIEVGGALALGKRVVPIFVHTGPNDLPGPLAGGLARDLNEIERYYAELEARRSGAVEPLITGEQTATNASSRRVFEEGDVVRIPNQPQPAFTTSTGTLIEWAPQMTAHAGRIATVTQVKEDRTVQLDVSGIYWWAMDWLDPAAPATA